MANGDGGMYGKVVVITGATSGIGTEAARELARMGARVVIVARDADRGAQTRKDIVESTGTPKVEVARCDLASQRDVRRLASELRTALPEIDVLVNNAGLTMADRRLTEDGIETTFAVNHLAPFLLTNLLIEPLEAGAPARVVTVASDAHRGATLDFDDLGAERGYSGWGAYCRSKLANVLFNLELARRLRGSGVTANCLHPGVVATGLGRGGPLLIRVFQAVARPLLLSPERGADTVVFLASSPEVEGASGGYYEKCRRVEPSAAARDRAAAERLWRVSEELTGLTPRESQPDSVEFSDSSPGPRVPSSD